MRSPDERPTDARDAVSRHDSADASTIESMLQSRTGTRMIEHLLQDGRIADAVQRARTEGLDTSQLFVRASRQYLRSSRPRLALTLYESTATAPPIDILRLYAALYRAEGDNAAALVLDDWLAGHQP